MVDERISELPDGAGTIATSNQAACNQSGTTRRVTWANLRALFMPIDLTADVSGDLPVADGGTGASDAATARTNLGAAASPVDLTSDVTGDLPVADGGTGASTAGAARTNLGVEPTASPTFTGTATMPDTVFAGSVVTGFVNKVSTVTGALNASDHGGTIVVTSGNVTVPQTVGFAAVIIAGGAHTVTFNSLASAAMAAGDVMTVEVQTTIIIKAVLTPVADLVSFS